MNPVGRRRFLIVLGTYFAIPGLLFAQGRSSRIAILFGSNVRVAEPYQKVFFSRLAELGYREGRNLEVDRRFAEGNFDRLPLLANEIVAREPDLIVASTTPPTLAVVKATRSIPIVFVNASDPVGNRIVQSLARPGGNVTGTSGLNEQLQAKQLQMLKEILPAATRVAILFNPLSASERQFVTVLQAEAPKLGLSLQQVAVEKEAAFPQAFKSIELAKPDVLYLAQSTFAMTHAARIMEFAISRSLPVIGGTREHVELGALMTYWSNTTEYFRDAAALVAKILEGASPADLPVQQVRTFEMLVNLKAAKALGIKIPQDILLSADRVIE